MDLLVLVQKLYVFGTLLQQFTVPNQSTMIRDLIGRGGSILRYQGSDGRQRASLCNLDGALSTPEVPADSFDRIEKLTAGQVVGIEIDLLPIKAS